MMVANKEGVLSRVESATIDGRMRILRFRQRQFQALFTQLSAHKNELVAAIQVDDGCSAEEAQLSFAAALLEVRNHYNELDLNRDIELEYHLAKGKSNETRRVPIDIAYIIPGAFGTFFTILSALSAAVCAGSCIIVELQNTVQQTPDLLKQYLSESLDKDAFCVIDFRAPAEFLSKCVVVDPAQELEGSSIISAHRWLSSSLKQNIAVVDRNADVWLASEELTTSRFAFRGQSCYAVDIILVNEFRADELIGALTQALEKRQDGILALGRSSNRKAGSSHSEAIIKEIESEKAKLLWGERTKGIVEIVDRSSPLLHQSFRGAVPVFIKRATSLDDTIDILQTRTNISSISALYLFATPQEAKYLSQHIPNEASFVNHIPSQLLIGPIAPEGYPISLYKRYSTEMFEYPSPQFSPSPRTHQASKILSNFTKVEALVKLAQKPLKPTGQPPAGSWGFFEQGMVLGALVYLLPMVSILLFGIGYISLYGYQRTFHS